MSTLWTQNSKLLISSQNKLYLCNQCPCDTDFVVIGTCCPSPYEFTMERIIYLHIGDNTSQPNGFLGIREMTLEYDEVIAPLNPHHYGYATGSGGEAVTAELECTAFEGPGGYERYWILSIYTTDGCSSGSKQYIINGSLPGVTDPSISHISCEISTPSYPIGIPGTAYVPGFQPEAGMFNCPGHPNELFFYAYVDNVAP